MHQYMFCAPHRIDTNSGLITNYEVLQHLLQQQKRYPTHDQLCKLQSDIVQQQCNTSNDSHEYTKLNNKLLHSRLPHPEYHSYTYNINNILPETIQSRLQLQYKLIKYKQLESTCWLHDSVVHYLQQCPSATQSHNIISHTIQQIKLFSEKYHIQFTVYEIQQIINIRPRDIIQLQLVIDELYDRFSNNDDIINELIDIITNNLPEVELFPSNVEPIDNAMVTGDTGNNDDNNNDHTNNHNT